MGDQRTKILVVSDIHYAGDAEKERPNFESEAIGSPILRAATRAYRHFVWLRDPMAHNHLLDRVVEAVPMADYVVANGDYSCDSAFVGVCDDAANQSAREALAKLREAAPENFRATIGDHELGKYSLFGGCGGMRLASWERSVYELGLDPFWKIEIGCYCLIGVTSSLLALPVLAPEALEAELPVWRELRRRHVAHLNAELAELRRDQRVILFCHDPSALPFLAQETHIGERWEQLEVTVIGHLHSRLILWESKLLAGMPTIDALGNTARRLSRALNQAKHWRSFNLKLCPALTGIQLLRDGGYYFLHLDPTGEARPEFEFVPLEW